MAECVTKDNQFYLVDCGEQFIRDYMELRDELYKQTQSLTTKSQLLWDVVRTLIVLLLPAMAMTGLATICHCLLPGLLGVTCTILLLSTAVGFVVLNLPPLNTAVNSYLDCKLYVPNFILCQCENCNGVDPNVTQMCMERTKRMKALQEEGDGAAKGPYTTIVGKFGGEKLGEGEKILSMNSNGNAIITRLPTSQTK
ncbi:uncharacterized protein LOC127866266 [Dreissena polymorpha]|uniref:Uncharacterized protein n=1 Tax=Dreissena polymorpha TaxID=45954 RepID=A0A9D4RDB9_DREPO|nr:uncharacterized protein LOC127866266 [Dreissena polymorpha]KAH3862472.1 hypothetical protein DPMN_025439 [Dreissena polymorpha]